MKRVTHGVLEEPSERQRRFPLGSVLKALMVLFAIILGEGWFLLWPLKTTHAAATTQQANTDCTLIVPAYPLSAQGLATPYQLVATNPDDGACHESNPDQAAFVQGSIFDFATGKIWVYNPLVIDQGTTPAIAPIGPQIPAGAVVALWFGFNGDNLTLQSTQNSLQEGHCVNGTQNSIFTQFAYCNAPLFFGEANQAINLGILTPPPLGMAKDGQVCPSVRDFSVVDQDQSDNVTTGYLVTKDGRIAQLTAANKNDLPNAQPLTNGSDNGLLDAFIDPALGCTPWMVPDLADEGRLATALPLNELQAMVDQQAPIALVPLNDPMVLNADGAFDLNKTNAYRAGVDQVRAQTNAQADPASYCQSLIDTGAPRLVQDAPITVKATTPDPATGNTLFTFLTQRYVNSYSNLHCQLLTGKPSPIATTQDGNGVAISATFKGSPVNLNAQPGGTPSCTMNGQMIDGCTGTVNVNGQSCSFSFNNNTVAVTCNPMN